MKTNTKISFTSVLKSKNLLNRQNNPIITSSQLSIDSQGLYRPHTQRLIDIYQQFQTYPDQNYTLDFNFKMSHKIPRGSVSMIKSKNMGNQDPQMNLDMWIENQKSRENHFIGNNNQSIKNRYSQKGGYKLGINSRQNLENQIVYNQHEQQQNLQLPQYNQHQQFQQTRNRSIGGLNKSSLVQPMHSTSQQLQQQYYNPLQNQMNNIQSSDSYGSQSNSYNNMQQSTGYNKMKMMQSSKRSENSIGNSNNIRSPRSFMENNIKIQKSTQSQQQFMPTPSQQARNSHTLKQSQSSKAHQLLQFEEFNHSRGQYPDLNDSQYNELVHKFQQIKSQKIIELCLKAKKIQGKDKQKMQQIVLKALENIYQQTEQLAEKMRKQKLDYLQQNKNKNKNKDNYQQNDDESMLIQDSHMQNNQHQQNNINQTLKFNQQQRRQQQMRNKIKGYITGIQQAKSQNNRINYDEDSDVELMCNNNTHNPHNNNSMIKRSNYQKQDNTILYNKAKNLNNTNNMNIISSQKGVQIDSVSYSFSNNLSNLICEHSFSRDLGNNFGQVNDQQNFQKYTIQPPIYEPEHENSQDQQQHEIPQNSRRISLENVQEVRSDCGDFTHLNLKQVEGSGQQIKYKGRGEQVYYEKKDNFVNRLEIDGNAVKNIQSVHYEPENGYENYQQYQQNYGYNNYQGYNNNQQRNYNTKSTYEVVQQNSYKTTTEIFKRFQPSTAVYEQKLVMAQNPVQQQSFSHNNSMMNSNKFSLNNSKSNKFQQNTSQIMQQHKNMNNFIENSCQLKNTNQSQGKVPFNVYLSKQKDLMQSRNEEQTHSITSSLSLANNSFVMNNSINNEITCQYYEGAVNEGNFNKISNKNVMVNGNNIVGTYEPIKHMHQLQSKNKFSIANGSPSLIGSPLASPAIKLDDKNLVNQTNNVLTTQFQQNNSLQNSYNNGLRNSNMHEGIRLVSIEIDNTNNNSLLQMQPLKISIDGQYKINSMNLLVKKQSNTSEISKMPSSRGSSLNHYQQEQIFNTNMTTAPLLNKQQSLKQGRQFLESLNTKQSIQLQSRVSKKVTQSCINDSFVEETFRPNINNMQNGHDIITTKAITKTLVTNPLTPSTHYLQQIHHVEPNKISITKINLNPSSNHNHITTNINKTIDSSSLPKPNVTSPKIISLSINRIKNDEKVIHQNNVQNVGQFNKIETGVVIGNVGNVTANSTNANLNGNIITTMSTNSINKHITLPTMTQHKQDVFKNLSIEQKNQNEKHVNLSMTQTNKAQYSTAISHTTNSLVYDTSYKQNNNTLNNNSIINKQIDSLGYSKAANTIKSITQSWKNEAITFDLNMQSSRANPMRQSKAKQALLKSSKNFGLGTGNITKMQQSIRNKGSNYNNNMVISKNMRQSIKGVKQSMGQDDDMDFDLELD